MVKLANNFDIAAVETWKRAKVNGQPMKLELSPLLRARERSKKSIHIIYFLSFYKSYIVRYDRGPAKVRPSRQSRWEDLPNLKIVSSISR